MKEETGIIFYNEKNEIFTLERNNIISIPFSLDEELMEMNQELSDYFNIYLYNMEYLCKLKYLLLTKDNNKYNLDIVRKRYNTYFMNYDIDILNEIVNKYGFIGSSENSFQLYKRLFAANRIYQKIADEPLITPIGKFNSKVLRKKG